MYNTNVYSTILGGCWHEKVVSVFSFGNPKSLFLALENGHFCQKCPFSGAKKWHFERPNLKTETTFSSQHPPKMVDYMFVLCVYHIWVGFKTILENCIFCTVLEPFSQQHGQKTRSPILEMKMRSNQKSEENKSALELNFT